MSDGYEACSEDKKTKWPECTCMSFLWQGCENYVLHEWVDFIREKDLSSSGSILNTTYLFICDSFVFEIETSSASQCTT
jgi:hypothetical protein